MMTTIASEQHSRHQTVDRGLIEHTLTFNVDMPLITSAEKTK